MLGPNVEYFSADQNDPRSVSPQTAVFDQQLVWIEVLIFASRKVLLQNYSQVGLPGSLFILHELYAKKQESVTVTIGMSFVRMVVRCSPDQFDIEPVRDPGIDVVQDLY